MEVENFWKELDKRNYVYPDHVMSDVTRYLKYLSPGDRQRLLDAFVDEAKYLEIKTRAGIMKIAKNLGLKKEIRETAFYYCPKCEIKFSTQSRGCPVCHTPLNELDYKTGIVRIEEAGDIIRLRVDCWECKHYSEKNENCRGPECGGWGKGHQGGPKCETCICARCCKEKYLYDREFEKFKELDFAGALEDRIMKEKQRA